MAEAKPGRRLRRPVRLKNTMPVSAVRLEIRHAFGDDPPARGL